MKKVVYLVEAVFVYILVFILRIIGIDASSNLGAFIARKIGPSLKPTQYAWRNIKFALPHLSDTEVQQIILEMWDNFGRTFFEMPHIYRLSKEEFRKRVQVIGLAKVKNVRQAIYITGHFGNWEVVAKEDRFTYNKLAIIYRKLNNPLVNRIMTSLRDQDMVQIPKGLAPSKQILKALNAGYSIGVLGDQKLDEGLAINFFNKPAQTLTSPVKLSIKYNLPIFFCRVVRTKGANFKLYIDGPVLPSDVQKDKDIELELAKKMNRTYEAWIKDKPSQWFWVHRRWEKEFYYKHKGV